MASVACEGLTPGTSSAGSVVRPSYAALVWYAADSATPSGVVDVKYKVEQPSGYSNADLYQLLADPAAADRLRRTDRRSGPDLPALGAVGQDPKPWPAASAEEPMTTCASPPTRAYV